MAKLTKANLESLLADWHAWANSVTSVERLGYSGVNHIAALARFSRARQHDDELDDDIDHRAHQADMQLADKIIGSMLPQLRMAISMLAKNLHSGAKVWSNPRLPKGPELERITDEACSVFMRRWDLESA